MKIIRVITSKKADAKKQNKKQIKKDGKELEEYFGDVWAGVEIDDRGKRSVSITVAEDEDNSLEGGSLQEAAKTLNSLKGTVKNLEAAIAWAKTAK